MKFLMRKLRRVFSIINLLSSNKIVKSTDFRMRKSKHHRTSKFEKPKSQFEKPKAILRRHANVAGKTGIINWKDCARELLNLPLLNPYIPFRPRRGISGISWDIRRHMRMCTERQYAERNENTKRTERYTEGRVKPDSHLRFNCNKGNLTDATFLFCE